MKNLEQEDLFDLRQTLNKYLYRWPYFVVSILITLSIAIVYLYFAKSEYEVKATLLIQDERKSSDEKSSLQEIEVVQSSKLVENEIEVLKSRNLILQVVNDLNLNIRYQLKDGYKKRDLYSKSPVQFQILDHVADAKGRDFEIFIQDNKTFLLKDSTDKKIAYEFNQNYEGEFGTWKLDTAVHINDYISKTIFISLQEPEKIADAYQKNLEVLLLDKNAPVVSLMITAEVEQRGKDFLNSLIEQYNTTTIAEKAQKNQSTLNFIDQRLAALSGELNASEAEVESFRSSRGLTDISSQSQVYLQNVQTNDIRLNEVNVQLNVIEGIENYLNASESAENLPSVVGISDPGLNNLIQQLSQLQNRKAELLATTPENNPVFNPLNRQINATRSAIKNNISNTKLALLNTKQELESFNSKFESSIRNIPGQERQLVSIKRQQAIKEDLYVYLLQKREELSLSYAATLTDARIIDSAYAGPVKEPNELLIIATAIILGFAFPAGFIFFKDSFSTKITTRKEIIEVVKAPIIMDLSMEKKTPTIVDFKNSKSAISEQFRSLRTHLQFLHGSREKGKVTLLTSSISEEGKSFIANNLAVSLANSGKKTVIVELDLRIPGLSENFKLQDGGAGISDYLMKEALLEDIIQSINTQPNLDVVVCGTIPPNPSELLELPELDSFFDYLRDLYDDIIIDTPPSQLVTDAHILSRLTDLTFYIIRQGHTCKFSLPYIENIYQKEHFPKMNILFNGIQEAKYGYRNIYRDYPYYQKKAFNI